MMRCHAVTVFVHCNAQISNYGSSIMDLIMAFADTSLTVNEFKMAVVSDLRLRLYCSV